MKEMQERQILTREEQTAVTRVLAKTAQMLASCGAESRLIEQTTCRIGISLGVEAVEMAITPSAIVLTTLNYGSCVTTTRRVHEFGINMQVLCELQRICIQVENGTLPDTAAVRERLEAIRPFRYNRWLVVGMIGLSCGSFCMLYGADWPVFLMTVLASSVAMFVRQEIGHRHFSPLINFAVTAFVATLIASLPSTYGWGEKPELAMAASVLLLVPGFPLINAMLDVVKGYYNMGLARWLTATMLTLSATTGIVLAMELTEVWGWQP
jgi:uncharacterized membrane protein YjjP (DUF1212 family)